MSKRSILLMDPASLRQEFLSETLADSGTVVHCETVKQAVAAIERGLEVDVAVLEYRLSATPLIRAVRNRCPKARVVAFGMPRPDVPLGVDVYLNHPLLSSELNRALGGKAKRARTAVA